MSRVNEEGRTLCKLQGEIFEQSLKYSASSSAVFVRRYMNSALAARLDCVSGNAEVGSVPALLDEVESKYGGKIYGTEHFAPEELYWMGYLYRCWAIMSGKSSKQLVKIISAAEMRKLYFPYHTLAPEQAIERISEAKGIREENELEKGVRLMRQVRSRQAKGKKTGE